MDNPIYTKEQLLRRGTHIHIRMKRGKRNFCSAASARATSRSLTNAMFYAALKAGAEMAAYAGDGERAGIYAEAQARGSAAMDAMLWGGEYYVQRLDDVDAYRYQQGTSPVRPIDRAVHGPCRGTRLRPA